MHDKEAETVRQLVIAGFTAESVVAAVQASNFALLKHSGKVDVQIDQEGDRE